MFCQVGTEPQVHAFGLPKGLEELDLSMRSEQASEHLRSHLLLDLPRLEEIELLGHGDNKVYMLRADMYPTGAFKDLSAALALKAALDKGHKEVVTATAGRFGRSLGWAAQAYGAAPPTAYVPKGVASARREAMEEFGVKVVEYGQNFDATREEAVRQARGRGVKFLDPYAGIDNMTATGVLGLAIVEQLPDVTDVVMQIGGGSLSGGISGFMRRRSPSTRLTGVQIAGCSPVVDSLRTAQVQEATDPFPRGESYFQRLGGLGVGKAHPLILGWLSRTLDSVETVRSDRAYATMHDVEQAQLESSDNPAIPGIEAAAGLEGARKLAREPGVKGAKIVAIMTGTRLET